MRNQHRVETLRKNYEMEELKRSDLMGKIGEKNKRSEKAKQKHEEERYERKFREFIQNEDKKFNVQRIASQQEYHRRVLDDRIHRDDLRSEKIKMERSEIMAAKQRLRREIDKDKQGIMEDFEMIKQGKIEPTEIAKKYGYVAKPVEDKHRQSHSHMPSIQNNRPNTMGNTNSQNMRPKPMANSSQHQDKPVR